MKSFTMFATAAVLFAGAASTAEACQTNPSAAAASQYRSPKKRIPLSTFLASVKANSYKSNPPAADGTPAAEPSIAGLWHTAFVAGPDQVEEGGFEQYGATGTHIANDPSPILSGNVCLGVWTQVAPLTYLVNHPSYVFDDKGEGVVGFANIYLKAVLDASGDTFKEDFMVVVTDMDGKVQATFEGKIIGKRVKAEDNPLK